MKIPFPEGYNTKRNKIMVYYIAKQSIYDKRKNQSHTRTEKKFRVLNQRPDNKIKSNVFHPRVRENKFIFAPGSKALLG